MIRQIELWRHLREEPADKHCARERAAGGAPVGGNGRRGDYGQRHCSVEAVALGGQARVFESKGEVGELDGERVFGGRDAEVGGCIVGGRGEEGNGPVEGYGGAVVGAIIGHATGVAIPRCGVRGAVCGYGVEVGRDGVGSCRIGLVVRRG